ncbi:LDH2 family malate/lactate/ureidoglycolate dehydrogenase [Tepidamorphus gemmatus]|uniref:LDH2 family malate/lactate/ureidoglycolate dehydrogenase n=1 Tax=Tepidamorphus gemmatus TaxID=747076 RepID=A0A4R3MKY8_9HYPH|nr:Ldh family oxidoreductase [Tepidamorphus gemmatus]TCT13428.1 LDH2 family malate/lactate/ureidoglycolate dehydrogenase [Tepidamorphus gemmatus]
MIDTASIPEGPVELRAGSERLARFCREVLAAAGADAASAEAAARAMLHGSRLGVDSHGVRLLPHYAAAIAGGRVNGRPAMRLVREWGAVATLDADDGHGALAAYTAMDHAVRIAEAMGIGAVAITRSSHFGPAGAYALAAAEQGMLGLATCNADSLVRLHDGAARFHGTNPIACAMPVAGEEPWLLDMATSAIPYNRVKLYRSLGRELPEGVASTVAGEDTVDASRAEMLAPLGGAFGYKGAGLAGLAEIFSAVLTGAGLSFELQPMNDPDMSRPRGLGAFVMALRPDAFIEGDKVAARMRRYRDALRASPARPGGRVMAPGDREWDEAHRRDRLGIPLDPDTVAAFRSLAERYAVNLPF